MVKVDRETCGGGRMVEFPDSTWTATVRICSTRGWTSRTKGREIDTSSEMTPTGFGSIYGIVPRSTVDAGVDASAISMLLGHALFGPAGDTDWFAPDEDVGRVERASARAIAAASALCVSMAEWNWARSMDLYCSFSLASTSS